MATDTEVLEFRNPITVKGNADSAITAIHQKSNKISNKKKVKETMAVPVKYDNEISAGDHQILYKVVCQGE